MSKAIDGETKPATHINIKIINGKTGTEVFFRIRRSMKLKKLMNLYCDRQSIDIKTVAFLYDGKRLHADKTPDDMEMEDGDQIDCMGHQIGGVFGFISCHGQSNFGTRSSASYSPN